MICGTNPRTEPTPATMPFIIRSYSHCAITGAPSAPRRKLSKNAGTHSPNKTSFAQFVPIVPIENGKFPIAIAYIKNITTAKIGRARMRFVTIRSILSETVSLPAFFLL